MNTTPFLAVCNDELGEVLKEHITCPNCGMDHEVEYGNRVMEDGTKRPSKMLSFYKCGDKAYLAGINGRSLSA
jgi:hypothetical protein